MHAIHPAAAPTNRSTHAVGSLGARWAFSSDHRPVGGTISIGKANISFACMNILNTHFISWIFLPEHGGNKSGGGSQGLDGSEITTHNTICLPNGLTQREQNTVDYVKSMLTPPHSSVLKRDLIGLQECSETVRHELNRQLPPNFAIIAANADPNAIDTQVYIYNKETLRVIAQDCPYSFEVNAEKNRDKKVKKIVFETIDRQASFCLLGVHLPFGPQAQEELAKYLVSNTPQDLPTILFGDMNAVTDDITKQIQAAFAKADKKNPFFPLTNKTLTHIDTQMQAADFDSIHLSPGTQKIAAVESTATELLPNLDKLDALLSYNCY